MPVREAADRFFVVGRLVHQWHGEDLVHVRAVQLVGRAEILRVRRRRLDEVGRRQAGVFFVHAELVDGHFVDDGKMEVRGFEEEIEQLLLVVIVAMRVQGKGLIVVFEFVLVREVEFFEATVTLAEVECQEEIFRSMVFVVRLDGQRIEKVTGGYVESGGIGRMRG